MEGRGHCDHSQLGHSYMGRTTILLSAVLLFSSTNAAVRPKETAAMLERTLQGEWKGGACQGTWTFRADGTFELKHYSPGNETLSGTWGVRWVAPPPTLGITIGTSTRPDDVGSKWELKIVHLHDETLTSKYPGDSEIRIERKKK